MFSPEAFKADFNKLKLCKRWELWPICCSHAQGIPFSHFYKLKWIKMQVVIKLCTPLSWVTVQNLHPKKGKPRILLLSLSLPSRFSSGLCCESGHCSLGDLAV